MKKVEEITSDVIKAAGAGARKIIPELGIYGSRADVAVITMETFVGIEIKSNADSLTRLPLQVPDYSLFDEVSLVAAPRHHDKALSIVPWWWSIVDSETMETVKPGTTNPLIDKERLATLIWKDEALTILHNIGADKGVRSKNRYDIHRRLVETLSTDELREAVRETLCARQNWR